MALPNNIFLTRVGVAGTNETTIYTAPAGYVGVILLAQAVNIDSTSNSVTLYHNRNVSGSIVKTEMLFNYPLDISDTLSMLSGKLALQTGDYLSISANKNDVIKYVVSLLETLSA